MSCEEAGTWIYAATMLWTIGGAIVAAILAHIAIAVIWPEDADKKDERDREIYRSDGVADIVLLDVWVVAAVTPACHYV